MVALPLHLLTATLGGYMSYFLLSVLTLPSSTPLGIMAPASAELNSKFYVQDRPHKSLQDVIPAYVMVPWPLDPSNGSLLAGFSIGTATNSFVPPTLAAGRANATICTGPETLSSPCGRHRAYEGSTLPQQGPTMTLLSM